MKWSWKIGKLAGVELRMHATPILLLGWVAAMPVNGRQLCSDLPKLLRDGRAK